MPHHSPTPRCTALALALGILAGRRLGRDGRRVTTPARNAAERKRLIARREKLLAELVRLERDRTATSRATRRAARRSSAPSNRSTARSTPTRVASRARGHGWRRRVMDFDCRPADRRVAALRPAPGAVQSFSHPRRRRHRRPARSERRREVDADRHPGDARAPNSRARCATASTPRVRAAQAAAADRPAGARAPPVRGADGAAEPGVLRFVVRPRSAADRSTPRSSAPALSDRADDQVLGFSRGMRQRLGLERALLHSPRLVLLDEPFTGLDDRSVGMVSERLRQLAARRAPSCWSRPTTSISPTVW